MPDTSFLLKPLCPPAAQHAHSYELQCFALVMLKIMVFVKILNAAVCLKLVCFPAAQLHPHSDELRLCAGDAEERSERQRGIYGHDCGHGRGHYEPDHRRLPGESTQFR